MNESSQAALREVLAGAVTKSGMFRVRVHCATCGNAVNTTRSALAAGEPPVWETREYGMTTFCPDHHPTCPGCGGHVDRLVQVYAWLDSDHGEINGLVCADCSAALSRRIETLRDDLIETADAIGSEPSSDEIPVFESYGDAAWKVRDPVSRFLTR